MLCDMMKVGLKWEEMGFREIVSPDELSRGDLVKLVGRGESTEDVSEVMDLRGTSVYLSAGKQYDFADHGDKRLVSVWRSPGDYISIANGCRSLLARILKFRNSRHFDGSQVGRAYSSLLRLAYAVERGSSENDLIETNRMLKFVWAWIKRNRKEFIWRKGEPHPKSYGGVWHKHGLFIGLRPHALAEVAESL
jgi:hypothetical protein